MSLHIAGAGAVIGTLAKHALAPAPALKASFVAAEKMQPAFEVEIADPEIQAILADPTVQQTLRDFKDNPTSAQKALKNPGMAEKINKLAAAGVIR